MKRKIKLKLNGSKLLNACTTKHPLAYKSLQYKVDMARTFEFALHFVRCDMVTKPDYYYSVWRRNSTCAEEVARFQRLFSIPIWLTSGMTSGYQKLVPTPMDRQLPDGD